MNFEIVMWEQQWKKYNHRESFNWPSSKSSRGSISHLLPSDNFSYSTLHWYSLRIQHRRNLNNVVYRITKPESIVISKITEITTKTETNPNFANMVPGLVKILACPKKFRTCWKNSRIIKFHSLDPILRYKLLKNTSGEHGNLV